MPLVPFRPKRERCLLLLQRHSLRMPSVTRKWVFPRWHPNFGSSLTTGRKTSLIESLSLPLLALNFLDHRQETCERNATFISRPGDCCLQRPEGGIHVYRGPALDPACQGEGGADGEHSSQPQNSSLCFYKCRAALWDSASPAQAGLEAYVPDPSIP